MLATCCVPFDADFNVDEAVFRRQVKLVVENGTPYVYVFGAAGEGYAVINWSVPRDFYSICCERNHDKIADMALKLNGMVMMVIDCFGRHGHMDGVFDKVYSKVLDNEFPLRLLPPLRMKISTFLSDTSMPAKSSTLDSPLFIWSLFLFVLQPFAEPRCV